MTRNQIVYVNYNGQWVAGMLAFQIDDRHWYVDVFSVRLRFHINDIRE